MVCSSTAEIWIPARRERLLTLGMPVENAQSAQGSKSRRISSDFLKSCNGIIKCCSTQSFIPADSSKASRSSPQWVTSAVSKAQK